MKSRKLETCNIDIHRASYANHLKSEKTFEKRKTKWNDYARMVNSRTY